MNTKTQHHVRLGEFKDFTETRLNDDIWYFAAIKYDTTKQTDDSERVVYVEFKAYKVIGWDTKTGAAVFEKADDPCCGPTESPCEAEVFLSGSVKWDGCSNWRFDSQDDVMIHFCSVGQAENVGKLFRWLYEIAADIMPDHRDLILEKVRDT